jgi:DNA-binding NarL/FixJ family response regulator
MPSFISEQQMAVRVLIVDDEAPFRRAARAVVEATAGFTVAGESETGEASVEQAKALHPDLVLMDVNLPGINGLEATRRIREDLKDVVVVVLSTYEEDEYTTKAAEAGAAAYVAKSKFDPARLTETWRSANGR